LKRIIAETPTTTEAKLLAELINEKLSPRLKAEVLSKRKPLLLLRNVDRDYDVNNLNKDIIAQNHGIRQDTFEMNFKRVIKLKAGTAGVHLLVQANAETRRAMISREKIYMGFQRINVVDALPTTQCFHCLKIGHTSAYCSDREKPPVCSHCAGNHRREVCDRRDQGPVCVNCKGENGKSSDHNAMDKKKCDYFKYMLYATMQRIQY
jgi:hypothetical protein